MLSDCSRACLDGLAARWTRGAVNWFRGSGGARRCYCSAPSWRNVSGREGCREADRHVARLYRRAAEQGEAVAQRRLGTFTLPRRG